MRATKLRHAPTEGARCSGPPEYTAGGPTPAGDLSMPSDSVTANCKVNLSVSKNGDDDHDDGQGAATGLGPDKDPGG